jgi:hypothetical protein
METNEKPLQSRVFFAIMQQYTQKTRKGDFWDGAQGGLSERRSFAEEKNQKRRIKK